MIHGEAFSEAIRSRIKDAEVKRLADKTLIGSIDQFSDSTDLRENAGLRAALRELFQ